MVNAVTESKKASILAWGLFIITILVTDKIGTDTVNVGKMLALTITGFFLLPFIKLPSRSSLLKQNSWFIAIVVLLILIFISMLTSENSFERGLYGAFGRNTGFLSYLSLSLLFIAATQMHNQGSFIRIQKALLLAGLFNIIYCLLAKAGYDIFSWNNPYKAVLGTFGNPNFIGSFMGIVSGALFIQTLASPASKARRAITGFLFILSFVVIYLADATQGLLVAAFGISISLYFYLRLSTKKRIISRVYLLSILIAGLVALLGILQKGPLAPFLYKPSVSFRGDYWKAGISMGKSDYLNGLGIDSYGLYYRTFRSLKSTINPGIEITTDASHNVVIDIFAGAGVLALISYVFLTIFVAITALKYTKSLKSFDPVFFTIFIAWASYQLQSLISINQLGLAVWGWALGGALIGYTRLQKTEDTESVVNKASKKLKIKKVSQELMPASMLLKVVSSGLVGFLLALPPFVADAKMRHFLSGKGTTEGLFKLAESWPHDSIRFNKSIIVLAQNQKLEEAKSLAAFGTTIFPNDFASWSALFELSPDGSNEKLAYKKRLHKIDPYNPKYFD